MLWWMNTLLVESLRTSVILWINFLKSFYSFIFLVFLNGIYKTISLSPRARSWLSSTVTMVLQYWFKYCSPWPSSFHDLTFWVVYISEGHSTNQRSTKNFLSTPLFPVTAIFLSQNTEILMLPSIHPLSRLES